MWKYLSYNQFWLNWSCHEAANLGCLVEIQERKSNQGHHDQEKTNVNILEKDLVEKRISKRCCDSTPFVFKCIWMSSSSPRLATWNQIKNKLVIANLNNLNYTSSKGCTHNLGKSNEISDRCLFCAEAPRFTLNRHAQIWMRILADGKLSQIAPIADIRKTLYRGCLRHVEIIRTNTRKHKEPTSIITLWRSR